VVGSGPNGLAAAITLARAGRDVTVYEAQPQAGGGLRSAALTLPGFTHDVCATAHPLALASPFFKSVGLGHDGLGRDGLGRDALGRHGLDFVHPAAPLAHPFDDRDALLLHRSIADTTTQLTPHDAGAYSALFAPLVEDCDALVDDLLGPLRIPRHPLAAARFGLSAVRSARGLAAQRFEDDATRALFCGIAAHAMVPLDSAATAGFGLVLAMLGHAVGWPFARGGSQRIADALIAELQALGGEVVTDHEVTDVDALHDSSAILLDLTPRQVLRVAGSRLAGLYRAQLQRYRYGAGAFKVDWALDGPIPWRDPRCLQAGTLHLAGGSSEVISAEAAVGRGEHPQRPFVLLCQPSIADPTRAPAGKHTAWAYCHVPNGSQVDMTDRIEAQVERFAPGFRERILHRNVLSPADLQRRNANMIGGDINGGLQDIRQLFTRPAVRVNPYATPDPRIFICSSSTPPGGGVHGLCGMFAAETAQRRARGFQPRPARHR
jgi:phytoene dehydrogenase-like protein